MIKTLCSPKIFFYTLIWLMVLVFLGTLHQKDIGLYAAQEKYFSSWFLYIGGVFPLPGGRLTLAVVFVNLVCKFMFQSKWSLKRTGVNITHFGALLLLAGGFVTAKGAYEGIMLIEEGGESNYFSDYHEVELAVIDHSPQQEDQVHALSQSLLSPGSVQTLDSLGMTIKVVEFYKNSSKFKLGPHQISLLPNNYRGDARAFSVTGIGPEKESEANMQGLVVDISGGDEEVNGRYVFQKNLNHPYLKGQGLQVLEWKGKKISLSLRGRRYHLPFSVALDDVETKYYDGTSKVLSYKSFVNVEEDGANRARVISMNEPLRSKGYTLYQSQVLGRHGEITGLATVKNAGRQVPYYSSIIICIGLLLHLVVMFPKLVSTKKGIKNV